MPAPPTESPTASPKDVAEPVLLPADRVFAPPGMRFALRWVNYLLLIPLCALGVVFFGTVSLLVGLWDTNGKQQHVIAHWWGETMLFFALSRLRLVHPERLPAGAAVYACNHLSYYDTPAVFARLPFQFRILAKAPLWKVPFVGWYLNRSGQVPIDQSSVRAGVVSLGRGVATLKQGMPLMIFPEGGRAATGELKSLASGAAYMAIKAQVPLVPLTLVGTYELLPIHVYALSPRPLQLIVGNPILTTGMLTKNADALTAQLRAVIHETYTASHDR